MPVVDVAFHPVDDLDVQLGVAVLVLVVRENIQGDLPQERLRDRRSGTGTGRSGFSAQMPE